MLRDAVARKLLQQIRQTAGDLSDKPSAASIIIAKADEAEQLLEQRGFLYRLLARPAREAKTALQMLVGVGAIVLLIIMVLPALPDLPDDEDVLMLIGQALAIAAAIELAYTLFTDGPDEVLDPLMLGLSAAMLLQLAKVQQFEVEQAGALALYAVGLAILFSVRSIFVAQPPSTERFARRWRRPKERTEQSINAKVSQPDTALAGQQHGTT